MAQRERATVSSYGAIASRQAASDKYQKGLAPQLAPRVCQWVGVMIWTVIHWMQLPTRRSFGRIVFGPRSVIWCPSTCAP